MGMRKCKNAFSSSDQGTLPRIPDRAHHVPPLWHLIRQRLTAKKPGSASSPTLVIEYGITLLSFN